MRNYQIISINKNDRKKKENKNHRYATFFLIFGYIRNFEKIEKQNKVS
jgi:hypothetical protein